MPWLVILLSFWDSTFPNYKTPLFLYEISNILCYFWKSPTIPLVCVHIRTKRILYLCVFAMFVLADSLPANSGLAGRTKRSSPRRFWKPVNSKISSFTVLTFTRKLVFDNFVRVHRVCDHAIPRYQCYTGKKDSEIQTPDTVAIVNKLRIIVKHCLLIYQCLACKHPEFAHACMCECGYC